MNTITRMCAVAIAASMTFAVTTQAQVTFAGSTTGCFFPTAGSCVPAATSNVGGLTYNANTFNVTSSPLGFVGIGNTPGGQNLGSLALTNTSFNYTGQRFNLRVAFSSPSGTTPSSTTFFADLIGEVTTTSTGGIRLAFNQTPQVFTYSGGTFTLVVDDQSVSPGGTVGLSGFIRTSVIPEPSTYLLMASGLLGIGVMGYRRRRNNT